MSVWNRCLVPRNSMSIARGITLGSKPIKLRWLHQAFTFSPQGDLTNMIAKVPAAIAALSETIVLPPVMDPTPIRQKREVPEPTPVADNSTGYTAEELQLDPPEIEEELTSLPNVTIVPHQLDRRYSKVRRFDPEAHRYEASRFLHLRPSAPYEANFSDEFVLRPSTSLFEGLDELNRTGIYQPRDGESSVLSAESAEWDHEHLRNCLGVGDTVQWESAANLDIGAMAMAEGVAIVRGSDAFIHYMLSVTPLNGVNYPLARNKFGPCYAQEWERIVCGC